MKLMLMTKKQRTSLPLEKTKNTSPQIRTPVEALGRGESSAKTDFKTVLWSFAIKNGNNLCEKCDC